MTNKHKTSVCQSMLPWRCLCISYAKTTSGQQKAKNLDVPWRANAFWFSGRASYSKMKCAWQSGKKLKSKHPKDSTASSHAPRSMIPDVIYIEARAAPHRHTSLARIPLPKCSHLGTSEFSRNGFDFRTWEYSNYTWLVGNLACCEDAAWYHTNKRTALQRSLFLSRFCREDQDHGAQFAPPSVDPQGCSISL